MNAAAATPRHCCFAMRFRFDATRQHVFADADERFSAAPRY